MSTVVSDNLASEFDAARASGDWEKVRDAAERIIAGESTPAFDAARASGNWEKVRDAAERIIAGESTLAADTFLALARACWHLKMLEPANLAAEGAIAADPSLTEALVIGAWVAVAQSDGQKAIKYYRRLAELNPHTSRWQLKVVQMLNNMGHIDEAVREANVLYQRWPEDRSAWTYFRNLGQESPLTRKLANAPSPGDNGEQEIFQAREKSAYQALEKAAPMEAEWRRPLIVAAPQLDVQIAEIAGAETAVLIFTGALDDVAIPLSTFDRHMAALEVTTIYLKDFNRLCYLGGVQSLGENYNATLAGLRSLLGRLGVKRLAVIGHCDGAASSINYGIELGAHNILSFGPITRFDFANANITRRAFMTKRLAETAPPELLDLKLFFEAHPHTAHVEIFYKQEDKRQRERAALISDIPGVTLHPLPGYPRDPPLLRLALSTGNLGEKLAEWLNIAPALRA